MSVIFAGMEHLKLYMKRYGLTQEQMAALIGCDQASVSKMLRNLLTPSLERAIQIERLTNGEVPVESWDAYSVLNDRVRHIRPSDDGPEIGAA